MCPPSSEEVLLARSTIAAAFHRISERILCSMVRSPGCAGSSCGAMVLTYAVLAAKGSFAPLRRAARTIPSSSSSTRPMPSKASTESSASSHSRVSAESRSWSNVFSFSVQRLLTWRLRGSRWEAGLARFDDPDHGLVDRSGHTTLFAQARDRTVNGINLTAASGVVVEQHRGTCVRDLAAELLDVLDRVADFHLHADRVRNRDGFLGAAKCDGHALGSAITSPMVSPVAQVVPENVTFMISFSQTIRCTSSRVTLKPDDSQILAVAC